MWGRGIGIPNGDLSYSLPWFFLRYLNVMLFDAVFSYLSIQFRPTSPGLESWAQDLEKSSSGLQDFQHRCSRSSGTSLLPQNVTGSGWTHHDTPVKPVKPVKPGVAHYWPWDRLWTRRNSLAVEVRKYYEMVRDFDIQHPSHHPMTIKAYGFGYCNFGPSPPSPLRSGLPVYPKAEFYLRR